MNWEYPIQVARRAARALVADVLAVAALAAVLGLLWWFGGRSL